MTWIRHIIRAWAAWLLACLGLLGALFVRPEISLADRFRMTDARPWPRWLWGGPYDALRTVVHWAMDFPPAANILVVLGPSGISRPAANIAMGDKDAADADDRPFRVGPRPTDYRPTAYRPVKWRPGALFPSFTWGGCGALKI